MAKCMGRRLERDIVHRIYDGMIHELGFIATIPFEQVPSIKKHLSLMKTALIKCVPFDARDEGEK
jgi:hypothetical protein